MEALALPVYIWTDLRDALGGPLNAGVALVSLMALAWLLTRVGGLFVADWGRRLEHRSAKYKRLLEATEAGLADARREARGVMIRLKDCETNAAIEKRSCHERISQNEKEIHELRAEVLNLKHMILRIERRTHDEPWKNLHRREGDVA